MSKTPPGPPAPPRWWEQKCDRCNELGSVSLWSLQGKVYRRFCRRHADEIARQEMERMDKRQRRYWSNFGPQPDPLLAQLQEGEGS